MSEAGKLQQPEISVVENFKVLICGDGAVGKTAFLKRFLSNIFDEEVYVPTVFNGFKAKEIQTEDKKGVKGSCRVILWDTAGQTDYDKLRKLTYPNTNLYIIAFSCVDKGSFVNVKSKWYKEIKTHLKEKVPSANSVPVILLGLKSDLKKDKTVLKTLKDNKSAPIKKSQGDHLAKQINALGYFETSSKDNSNVAVFFSRLARFLLEGKKKKSRFSLKRMFKKNASGEHGEGNKEKTVSEAAQRTMMTLESLFQMKKGKGGLTKSVKQAAKIMNEFITNEMNFVDNIKRLMENLQQLKKKNVLKGAKGKESDIINLFNQFKSAVSMVFKVHVLFLNDILKTYDVNKEGFLIYEIETQFSILEKCNSFFEKNVFSFYYLYLENFILFNDVLLKLNAGSKKNKEILQKLDLFSLLSAPLQKLVRYKLFFEKFGKLQHVKENKRIAEMIGKLMINSHGVCQSVNQKKLDLKRTKEFVDIIAYLNENYKFGLYKKEKTGNTKLDKKDYCFSNLNLFDVFQQEKMDVVVCKNRFLLCYHKTKEIDEVKAGELKEYYGDCDFTILTLKIGVQSFFFKFDIALLRNLKKYFEKKFVTFVKHVVFRKNKELESQLDEQRKNYHKELEGQKESLTVEFAHKMKEKEKTILVLKAKLEKSENRIESLTNQGGCLSRIFGVRRPSTRKTKKARK